MGYDLAVIGSGGAGFAAAIAATAKGRSVVMIERTTIGGTCVNTGCVPSKALLAAAAARHAATAQAFPGIHTEAGPVDATALRAGKDELVEHLRTRKYVDLADRHGWEILAGRAAFVDGPALDVTMTDGTSRTLRARHFLIATGSAPWVPPLAGLDEVDYLTSTTAMELAALPESLVVIGGGYVGLEQAQLFARLGVKVTVVGRFAPHAEPELAELLREVFRSAGITVRDERATAIENAADGVVVTTHTGHRIQGDRALMATGRRPVTADLNLDAVGVKTGTHGEIAVDGNLRTANPRIWAAGDVTGHPGFVYVAGAHGRLAADNAFDTTSRTVDVQHAPSVTFTSPALATVGMTSAAATQAGHDCESRVLPLSAVPRALADRDTLGAVKLVADRGTGRLLGAHALAHGAGDIIAAAVYALANEMTVPEIATLWCPYLTMAEALKLAAQSFTRDVSALSCCAS